MEKQNFLANSQCEKSLTVEDEEDLYSFMREQISEGPEIKVSRSDRHPSKFNFCSMSTEELERLIKE